MPEASFYRCSQKSRHGKPTVVWRCKECLKAKRKARYREDPKASNEAVNAWRAANREASRTTVTRCYRKNKGRYLPKAKERREGLRLSVLRHYSPGPACELCQEPAHEFLVLDHEAGGGTEHRQSLGAVGTGSKFYRWVKQAGFPDGLRVLCHNCNFKEHLCLNREAFKGKGWDPTHKTRVIGGMEYPVDLRKQATAQSRYDAAVKLECLVEYSSIVPSCACCSNEDLEVLSIDHVDGGGREHRKKVGNGKALYQWLRKHGFPPGYRVLCLNCNFALGLRGHCPHADNRSAAGGDRAARRVSRVEVDA